MNIVIGTIALWALALFMARKLGAAGLLGEALATARFMLGFTGARLVVALLGAGFVAELLPEELIRQSFGQHAGLTGIALAVALGPITPGGAFVSFAVGAAALKAGATPAPVVAYVTSWSLFALTKFVAYELPLVGRTPALARVAVSWPIPFVIGALALLAF